MICLYNDQETLLYKLRALMSGYRILTSSLSLWLLHCQLSTACATKQYSYICTAIFSFFSQQLLPFIFHWQPNLDFSVQYYNSDIPLLWCFYCTRCWQLHLINRTSVNILNLQNSKMCFSSQTFNFTNISNVFFVSNPSPSLSRYLSLSLSRCL